MADSFDGFDDEFDQDAIISMMDDEGNVLDFECLLEFEYGGEPFIAFTPIEPMEDFDTGEVLIMREGEDETGEIVYLPIDSQEELDELWQVFKGLYYEDEDEDLEDFDDEDDEVEADEDDRD